VRAATLIRTAALKHGGRQAFWGFRILRDDVCRRRRRYTARFVVVGRVARARLKRKPSSVGHARAADLPVGRSTKRGVGGEGLPFLPEHRHRLRPPAVAARTAVAERSRWRRRPYNNNIIYVRWLRRRADGTVEGCRARGGSVGGKWRRRRRSAFDAVKPVGRC